MSDDEFGSDDWGDVDEEALIAATNQVEQEQVITSSNPSLPASRPLPVAPPQQKQSNPGASGTSDAPLFLDDDFDNSDDEFRDPPRVITAAPAARNSLVRSSSGGFRQSTLFGGIIEQNGSQSSSTPVLRSWPLVNTQEPPTHHKIDREAAKTWIYPANIPHRDYQYSIVSRALFSNVLVALPTGLGKTLIAATVMLNFFRWAPEGQIAFLAPTKPLVTQQIDACFNIVGIPRSATAKMTGSVSVPQRRDYWEEKRVFFLTPQTMQNDIAKGICDAKRIVCLVIDEAHRATGNYAYVQVIKLLRRVNNSFRILALTATPGSTIDKVQAVIDSCGIAGTEIRNLESLDIRPYVHKRIQHLQVFQLTNEMVELRDLYCKCLEPLLKKLVDARAYWTMDVKAISLYGIQQAGREWMASNAGRDANPVFKGMMLNTFATLSSFALPLHFLTEHGVRVFFNKLSEVQAEVFSDPGGGSKTKKGVINDENFRKVMRKCQELIANKEYSGHPKLDYMASVVLKHFFDAEDAETKRETRIMIFTSYRSSAEEIVRVLNKHQPIVKPHIFVGQADAKGVEGMKQKDQIEVIEKFQEGTYNVIVATSIGEEGLDIGEVDMIICYDQQGSSIRLLQRMGRTGRKRDGHVHILLTQGKEEENFKKATRAHEFIQGEIESGKQFNYHHDLSPRIVPRDIECVVDRKVIEIPTENTQPEPAKQKTKGKGKQTKITKKFLMPDGVITGFMKASRIGKGSVEEDDEEDDILFGKESLAPDIIDPEAGLLTRSEEKKLQRTYQTDWSGVDDGVLVVSPPRIDAFSERQRTLTKTHHVRHGRATKSMARALQRMHDMDEEAIEKYKSNLDMTLVATPPEPAKKPLTKAFKPVIPRNRPGLSERSSNAPKPRQTSVSKRKRNSTTSPPDVEMAEAAPMIDLVSSQDEDEDEDVRMASDTNTISSGTDSDVGVIKRRRKLATGTSEDDDDDDGEEGDEKEEEGEDFLDVGQMLEKWAPKKTIMLPPKKTANKLPKHLRAKPAPMPVPKATFSRAKRVKRVVCSDDE
ncbi:P-loop containing nucleoside triphosphate hydrolase protein [Choiromyces venosus 120613-1]|uniref:ATP-dependent DNA helicase n=1 Tax=Choiromyces venosus 120613-1 TaxID=1336337 RepID=A0A3N4JD03_9PEZI|nr:P-loop containing nucleoside triphosphate hydrolase protein [Choiromyces venosus 120613-1]